MLTSSWRRQDVAISIAPHKANVYSDLSGWSQKYFPPELVKAVDTMLAASYCSAPTTLLTPDRSLADFAQLPIRPDRHP